MDCLSCGADNYPGAQFCHVCGAELSVSHPVIQIDTPKEALRTIQKSKHRWRYVLLLPLLFALIALWFVAWPNKPAPLPDEVEFADASLQRAVRRSLADEHRITKENLAKLTSLYIQGVPSRRDSAGPRSSPVDLRGIEQCTNLKELMINSDHVLAQDCLSELTTLQKLGFSSGSGFVHEFDDLRFLAKLTNLRHLHFWLGPNGGLDSLSGLTSLETLRIEAGSYPPLDLSPLRGLKNLRMLRLRCRTVSDLTPLSDLSNLENLAVAGTRNIRDLAPLAGLTKLRILQLGGNQISGLGPLARLTNLRVLLLEANEISDITPLANLTKLRWLSIAENQISNISALEDLSNLEALDLEKNQIRDIRAIAHLENSGYFDYWTVNWHIPYMKCRRGGMTIGNRVTAHIYLQGNPLNDEAYDVHIPALEKKGFEIVALPRRE